MENGYLSGLLRQPSPAGSAPTLPTPPGGPGLLHSPSTWGLRGPGLLPHPSHHPPPPASFHPLCPSSSSSSSHPSSSPASHRHSSRSAFEQHHPHLRPSFYEHQTTYHHHHHPSAVKSSDFKTPPFLLPPPSPNSSSSAGSSHPSSASSLHHSNYGGFGFLGPPPSLHHPREGSLFPPPPCVVVTSSSFHSVVVPGSPRSDSFTQALLNLSKVAPRNSMASSTVVTSVSSSQVFKRETGSAFSAPSKTPLTSPKEGPLNSVSKEEEEVLVDDFDGQCCRTYPLNHSRILKWREEREKGSRSKKEANGKPSASLETVSSSTSSTAPLASNPNSAIPVGIAIGRQRQLHEKPPLGPSEASKRGGDHLSLVSRGSGNAPSSHLDSGGGGGDRPSHLHPPVPPHGPWGPGPWHMDSLPPPFPHHPPSSAPWGTPHHPMGPIPMGYQLAKDPLTGQILLIPTDGGGPSRPNHLWGGPGFEGGGSHGLPPYPNAPYHSPHLHHHHHQQQQQQQQLYLQQQMHYMRQQQPIPPPIHHHLHSASPPSRSSSLLCSSQKLQPAVPETINLESSSEDEDEGSKALGKSESSPQGAQEEAPQKPESEKDKASSSFTASKEEEFPAEKRHSPSPPLEGKEVVPPSIVSKNDDHASSETSQKPIPKALDSTLPEASSSKLFVSIENRIGCIKKEKDEEVLSINAESLAPTFNSQVQIKAEVVEQEESHLDMGVDEEEDSSFRSSGCSIVVEALLSLGQDLKSSSKDNNDPFDGFESLIAVFEGAIPTFDKENGLELLCRAVKDDASAIGLPSFYNDAYHLDVNLLCSVTALDHVSFLNYVDPLVSLRSKFDLHSYHFPEKSREFIANRIKRAEAMKYDNGEVDKYEGIKTLAAVIKKIKNTEIMSQLEVELRGALVQIQSSYREKQKELARLKARSPKKKRRSSSSKRPPGRPKKRKTIINSPSKHLKIKSSPHRKSTCSDNDADEETEYEEEDLSPPILEPANASEVDPSSPMSSAHISPASSGLLKPPKLTASSSLCNQVTNLSTIKARFMRGKENPFANLMKLATTPSSSKPGSTKSGDSDEEKDEELDDEGDHKSGKGLLLLTDEAPSTEDDELISVSSVSSTKDLATFTIKKRKSDNPQKHCASTETLVTKKPKNLFMMNRLNYPSSFSEDRDEYEFEEEEEEVPERSQEHKKISFADYASSSSFDHNSPAKNETVANSSTSSSPNPPSKGAKSTTCSLVPSKNLNSGPPLHDPSNGLRSAKLSADDLKDGLKLLMLNDGRFWPARLNSTQLPDVYGVVMEKQRGNRPQILPRDDILQECIMEVKPENKDQIPPGTRVCVYWSSAYNCLFPGTVESNESLIQVELDDGDTRDVVISNVRMLPYNYSHVFHDPDPIATLRKRRQSSDSAEGRDLSHKSTPLLSTPSKSEPDIPKCCPSSPEVKSKKKHKHHKKHKPLRVKLDGTFNNTTTYSIRSPPVYSNSRVNSSSVEPSRINPTLNAPKAEEESEEEDLSEENKGESPDDEEFEDDESSDNEDNHQSTHMSFFKGKTSSKFNPVTGRPLWAWGDDGYRRPGSKGKAKKLFHRSITRENEVLSVGDCAVFLSMAQVDRPYIGRIDTFWETWNSGHMMVKVKWFYHPEEIETNEKNSVDLKVPGGLFQSPHMDENDVQTISHKCSVIPFKDFLNSRSSLSDKRKKNSNVYYLAGNYEPGTFAVQCLPGVLKCYN